MAIKQAVSDRVCSHMNKDHSESLLAYAWVLGGQLGTQSAEMKRVDVDGFDLTLLPGDKVCRIPFSPPLKR